jgi:hypothetical protein
MYVGGASIAAIRYPNDNNSESMKIPLASVISILKKHRRRASLDLTDDPGDSL